MSMLHSKSFLAHECANETGIKCVGTMEHSSMWANDERHRRPELLVEGSITGCVSLTLQMWLSF